MENTSENVLRPPTATASQLFTREEIKDIAAALVSAAAPARKLTRKETLATLAPELKKAVEKGHTKESIAAVLATRGLIVSARAIARALAQAKHKS